MDWFSENSESGKGTRILTSNFTQHLNTSEFALDPVSENTTTTKHFNNEMDDFDFFDLDAILGESKPAEEVETLHICGEPVFLRSGHCHGSFNQCTVEWKVAMLATIMVLLAVIIIFGNILIPYLAIRERKLRKHSNYIKISLAIADIIIGFLILLCMLPNMLKMRYSSEQELLEYILNSQQSPVAVFVGSLVSLSLQSSLYHMIFLSLERLFAIQWPIWSKKHGRQFVAVSITVSWLLPIIICFLPVYMPQNFNYEFSQITFMYRVVLKNDDFNRVERIMTIVMIIFVPFIITVLVNISTIVCVWRALNGTNSRMLTSSLKQKRLNLRLQYKVVITISFMIAAFTFTILPYLVVEMLFHGGRLTCSNYAIPYLSTLFVMFTNSFLNVIIYTARDITFRRVLWRQLPAIKLHRIHTQTYAVTKFSITNSSNRAKDNSLNFKAPQTIKTVT